MASGSAAIGEPVPAARSRRPFGVRIYLTIAFAAVALIAAGLSYLLITGSSEEAASERAADITVGRAVRLADRIGAHPRGEVAVQLTSVSDPGFSAWAFHRRRNLLTPPFSHGVPVRTVPGRRQAVAAAVRGARKVRQVPGSVTVVSVPLFRGSRPAGALLVRAERPQTIARALDAVQGDRLTAAAIAVAVAGGIGSFIATPITTRGKRPRGR